MKMVKKRRKRTKNNYFTKVHEDAIVKYANSTDRKERAKLYESLIQPAFDEMVNKIIFTYKFNTLPNIDPLREDCKIWLTTILEKYDPNKGSKAFSYFSVITKNWFIHQVKKRGKKNRLEVDINEMPREQELKHVSIENPYQENREHDEFFIFLRILAQAFKV